MYRCARLCFASAFSICRVCFHFFVRATSTRSRPTLPHLPLSGPDRGNEAGRSFPRSNVKSIGTFVPFRRAMTPRQPKELTQMRLQQGNTRLLRAVLLDIRTGSTRRVRDPTHINAAVALRKSRFLRSMVNVYWIDIVSISYYDSRKGKSKYFFYRIPKYSVV